VRASANALRAASICVADSGIGFNLHDIVSTWFMHTSYFTVRYAREISMLKDVAMILLATVATLVLATSSGARADFHIKYGISFTGSTMFDRKALVKTIHERYQDFKELVRQGLTLPNTLGGVGPDHISVSTVSCGRYAIT
jgi:hypothetical protein